MLKNFEGERLAGKHKRKWRDAIKIDLKGTGYEDINWINWSHQTAVSIWSCEQLNDN
jgi:hypothetical protein